MKTALIVVSMTSLLAAFASAGMPHAPGHGGSGNAGTGGSSAPESWTGAQTAAEHAQTAFKNSKAALGRASNECAEAGSGMSSDVAERERKKREACGKKSAAHNSYVQAKEKWRDASQKALEFAKNELKNAKTDDEKKAATAHVNWATTNHNNAEHAS